jgi:quercetin dioxygenase-like cupin family protein
MPVLKYDEMRVHKMGETIDRRQAHTENLMLAVIDLSGAGSAVPLHAHPHEQISFISQGRLIFTIGEGQDQEQVEVGPGDVVIAPPNVPHGVKLLSDQARVVDSFHPIREDFL